MVAVLVAYGIWVQYPRLQHRAVAQAAFKSTESRFKELSLKANDPEQNGYVNPALLPYWSRSGIDHKVGSQAESAIRNWINFSSIDKDELVHHGTLWETQEPEYLRCLQEMEDRFSELKKAVQKPNFFPLNVGLEIDSPFVDFISARQCCVALSALGEAYTAQGKFAEAADCLLVSIEFGKVLGKDGPLIALLIGVGCQKIGVDTLAVLITPWCDLSGSQWADLSRRTLKATYAPDQFRTSLEWEFTAGRNSISKWVKGNAPNPPTSIYARFPGIRAREKRIYLNTMAGFIVELKKHGTIGNAPQFTTPTFYDMISGKVALLEGMSMRVPDQDKIVLDQIRIQTQALGLSYGLLSYRAQKGHYPATLSKLDEIGIDIDSGIPTVFVYKTDGTVATLRTSLNTHAPGRFNRGVFHRKSAWFEIEPGYIKATLGAKPKQVSTIPLKTLKQ